CEQDFLGCPEYGLEVPEVLANMEDGFEIFCNCAEDDVIGGIHGEAITPHRTTDHGRREVTYRSRTHVSCEALGPAGKRIPHRTYPGSAFVNPDEKEIFCARAESGCNGKGELHPTFCEKCEISLFYQSPWAIPIDCVDGRTRIIIWCAGVLMIKVEMFEHALIGAHGETAAKYVPINQNTYAPFTM
ncbi:MAG TPA: hypothetical protein VMV80_04215, partial [Anaerolineales bacterium]|nr:hypothetical protein [Anaerolineales bacterium]